MRFQTEADIINPQPPFGGGGVEEVEDEEVDRVRGGKRTSKSGQGWSSPIPRGQWRIGNNGERTEEEVGRQRQRVDRAGVRQLPEGCGG